MIRIENLQKSYEGRQAVDGISLEIASGELCVLLGPSGCGKSTTLKIINKLLEPEGGSVFINGQNITDIDSQILRRGMGYVIQDIGLFPHFTVEKNISTVPDLLKWDEKRKTARVRELLELIGLDYETYRKKYPRQLSGGESQRIGVARALAADPPILLMDEPFGAVDPLNRKMLQTEFKTIQQKLKKTVIFVTHDIEEAIYLADTIVIMKDGRIEQKGSPGEILKHPRNSFITDFIGPDRALLLLESMAVSTLAVEETRGCTDQGSGVTGEATLKRALSAMLEAGMDCLDVVTSDGETTGKIHLSDIYMIMQSRGDK